MKKEHTKELMIYIHIPFCVRKCLYCDFLSAPADEDTKKAYMEALCLEIHEKSVHYGEYEVSSIFFGGGTPTAVEADWIQRIMQILRTDYQISEDAEITMEMNPGTVEEKDVTVYSEAGINRLSIGLQSAWDEELQSLGRIHTYEKFLETYDLVRKAGFNNVNVDLMSALPGQTPQKYRESLEKVLGLMPPPEHISAYSLIIEEETPFYKAYEEDRMVLPTEEEEREMYHLTKCVLEQYGYERYEISNYAKPGKECRHNIGYWQRKNYVGFGIGAASLVENERFANGRDLEAYIKTPCEVEEDRENLSVEEQMAETMFLGLRMEQGVSESLWMEEYHRSLTSVYGDVLQKHLKNGLLEWTEVEEERFIRLTEKGIDVSNYVMADFLEPKI